jgi:hypothetical protein
VTGRRALLSALVVTGAAVPAVAQLTQPRAEPAPAQLSINTAAPAFDLAGMVPGDAVTRCIRVRNEGAEPVTLAEGLAITGGLAEHLVVAVQRGSGLGDAGPSCAGFAPAGTYAFGTGAAGVPVSSLTAAATETLAAGATRSYRITILLPSTAPNTAMVKTATVTGAWVGVPQAAGGGGGGTTPDLPGGIAPGTTGGFDKDGNFLTNSQIKKRLRIGRARLLKNGNVVVKMFLPAGGAIRAKVILPNGVYYAHTLLPEEWGPTVRVLLVRRAIGRTATVNARRAHRSLVTRVTTRYRWAHGPHAFVEPHQKLTIVKRRR